MITLKCGPSAQSHIVCAAEQTFFFLFLAFQLLVCVYPALSMTSFPTTTTDQYLHSIMLSLALGGVWCYLLTKVLVQAHLKIFVLKLLAFP